MRKREATEEEKALFRAVVAGKVVLSRPKKPKSATGAVKSLRVSSNRPSGIDGNTAEKLTRGARAPEARIDLHGMTERAAHHALVSFILTAAGRGVRLALVITGKGARKIDPYAPFDMELERRARGVLKEMVPRWLHEPPLVRMIADIRPAHVRHGGTGALYVYLRK